MLVVLFSLQTSQAFASETNKPLIVKVDFYSEAEGISDDHPLHIVRTVKIDPHADSNTLVMTQSKIENNFPVTLAMLVRPTDLSRKRVSLRFNLVQYSFIKHTTILSQPGMMLRNGQTGEIKEGLFHLKVKAKWDERAVV